MEKLSHSTIDHMKGNNGIAGYSEQDILSEYRQLQKQRYLRKTEEEEKAKQKLLEEKDREIAEQLQVW